MSSTEPGNKSAVRPIRVAHLISHPIQYFVPLYRELATRADIELTVYFYSAASLGDYKDEGFGRTIKWDVPLLGGYQHRILPSASKRKKLQSGFLVRPNLDLLSEVLKTSPDVVWIHGYMHLNALLAVGLLRLRGIPILLRDEQTMLDTRVRWKQLAKQVFLRRFLASCYVFYLGVSNKRYFKSLGVPEERCFRARYTVDNQRLRGEFERLRGDRQNLRAAFGIADSAPVILFCAKLIDKKQPLRLLSAFKKVRESAPCWLLVAGDGELRAEMEARVKSEGIPNVLMAGFLNQTEIPKAYVAADIFALPSAYQETWGLVVNEAMNFELPVVVSDKVGCGPDLVIEGKNGFIYPHEDTQALASHLLKLVSDESLRRRFGQYSGQHISTFGIKDTADDIVSGCVQALGQSHK